MSAQARARKLASCMLQTCKGFLPPSCMQVFSKLETGRVPSIDELVGLLELAMGLPAT